MTSFVFLAVFIASASLGSPVAGLPDGRNLLDGRNNDGTCNTNEECKGRKVCDIENNRCVNKCIEDSDCRTGKAAPVVGKMMRRGDRGQRTGQFCFLFKCQDTLPGKATCIKDSWCTSGMCKNDKCAEGKTGGRGYW